MLSRKPYWISLPLVATLALGIASCGGGQQTADTGATDGEGTTTAAAGDSDVSGSVLVDGSSTVFPISEAMAEEFMSANPDVRVTVGVSGSGGGFKKFCAGETDISNASRPIKPEERELCAENGIEYIELPIAYDGISVVVHPENDWAACLTTDELKTMWESAAQGQIDNWNQINPEFPDQTLSLYGPGTDSGTYDYFTENIVGEEGDSRGDYTASEDDNVIVQGVSNDPGGLGFFGYAYYEENQERLNLVAVDAGNGCIEPSTETIADGTYQPLSRPEFFYVKQEAADRPEVQAFVEYQLDPANNVLIKEVGYVPVPDDVTQLAQERYASRTLGSVYEDASGEESLKELMEK